jgi:pilus assembly protein CpaB
MRAKTILTVLFLVSLGVAVMVLLRAMPRLAPATAEAAKDEVLVATEPLAAGTLLRPQDVVWQQAKDTERGEIVRLDAGVRETKPELDEETRAQVYGAALRKPLAAGEAIRRQDIVKPGDRDFLQSVLAPGMRAIAIPVHLVGRQAPNSRFLGPFAGDRVDLILTQKFQTDLPLTRRSVGESVVENLRVLAVVPPDPKANTGGNDTVIPLTLEVTSEQAEKINVAQELGKLSLTLRSLGAGDGAIANTAPHAPAGAGAAADVRPIWAGDVSPALGGAMPAKQVTVERPPVEVIRGSKSETVKAPWHPDNGAADRGGARAENGRSSNSSDSRD